MINYSLIAQLVKTASNAGDPNRIPVLGRSAGERIGYPFQYSWASLVAQLVKNPPAMWETWVVKIPWRRERLLTPVFWPGEFHGLCSPWGCKLDPTDNFHFHFHSNCLRACGYYICFHFLFIIFIFF